ncbi:MAG: hypothetical protein ACFWT7_04250 [Succiniclasticum sp.]
MAKKILWNEYEEAVLLDALIKVLNHKLTRSSAISDVSRKLRIFAARRGNDINEKFRNENGINLQMACLEYAYTKGSSGLAVTGGWYFDIVRLYNHDRRKFESLLRTVEDVVEKNGDNRTRFEDWLSGARSSNESRDIIASLKTFELLLRKRGSCRDGIFKINNPSQIENLIKSIGNNKKGIRLISKRLRDAVLKALHVYKLYLGRQSLKLDSEQLESKSSEFRRWLSKKGGMDSSVCNSYVVSIRSCGEFCQNLDIGAGNLFELKSSSQLERVTKLVIADVNFQNKDKSKHYLYSSALGKYIEFLKWKESKVRTVREMQPRLNSSAGEVDEDEIQKIRATLELPTFAYGFRGDYVELQRFRQNYNKINNSQCPLKDDDLRNVIKNMGFEYEGKIYILSDSVVEQIMGKIRAYKNQGASIIYYDQFYNSNYEECDKTKIISSEMLREVLKSKMQDMIFKSDYVLLTTNERLESDVIKDEIIRVWGNSTQQSFEELSKKLQFIPSGKVKNALNHRSEFITNSAGVYLQKSSFTASEDEIKKLKDYVENQCNEHGSVSLDTIPFENLREENPDFSDKAFYECFFEAISDKFERNCKILTLKGSGIDTSTAIAEFCRSRGRCTFEQLKNISEQVSGKACAPEIIEIANDNMVRIDRANFVSDNKVTFDVEVIDKALDRIVKDYFIGLREIMTFTLFPSCGYSWNLYLLESYCRRFSKRYRFLTRSKKSLNSGAIVSNECSFNYHEIMVHAAARSNRDLNKEEVFEYLKEAGYIERKRYSAMDQLLKEARELRERRT